MNYSSDLRSRNYNDTYNEAVSELNYTQYTDHSALDDSVELEKKTEVLVEYNQRLIDGFEFYQDRNLDGLVQNFRKALILVETQPSPAPEHLISVKSNLGIALFYNGQPEEAIEILEDSLRHLDTRRAIECQNLINQSIFLKVKVILFSKFSG